METSGLANETDNRSTMSIPTTAVSAQDGASSSTVIVPDYAASIGDIEVSFYYTDIRGAF